MFEKGIEQKRKPTVITVASGEYFAISQNWKVRIKNPKFPRDESKIADRYRYTIVDSTNGEVKFEDNLGYHASPIYGHRDNESLYLASIPDAYRELSAVQGSG